MAETHGAIAPVAATSTQPLLKLSSSEFKIYNRMADHMDLFVQGIVLISYLASMCLTSYSTIIFGRHGIHSILLHLLGHVQRACLLDNF